MGIKKLAEAGLDLIFPPELYCICCGNAIDKSRTYHLCDHCIEHFRWDGSEILSLGGMKVLRCAEYGLYERTLIFGLKYNGKTYLARDIAKIMADRLELAGILGEERPEVIVPVPMHRAKEKKRGFNQAAILGKYLGREIGAPCLDHCLIRTEDTLPMRGLSPDERRENVRGKFTLNPNFADRIDGKRVLLLDDFYTTGSTASECFRQLKEGGAKDTLFLAFAARDINDADEMDLKEEIV